MDYKSLPNTGVSLRNIVILIRNGFVSQSNLNVRIIGKKRIQDVLIFDPFIRRSIYNEPLLIVHVSQAPLTPNTPPTVTTHYIAPSCGGRPVLSSHLTHVL